MRQVLNSTRLTSNEKKKLKISKKKIVETVNRSKRLREREKWATDQQHSVAAESTRGGQW
jgi:hypothetical protein